MDADKQKELNQTLAAVGWGFAALIILSFLPSAFDFIVFVILVFILYYLLKRNWNERKSEVSKIEDLEERKLKEKELELTAETTKIILIYLVTFLVVGASLTLSLTNLGFGKDMDPNSLSPEVLTLELAFLLMLGTITILLVEYLILPLLKITKTSTLIKEQKELWKQWEERNKAGQTLK